MKFMIMVFGEQSELLAKPSEWIERMIAYLARLDDELAHSGELVYSEVLEYGHAATTISPVGEARRGSTNGTDAPLSRYWVVKVTDEQRAIEIASGVAEVVGSAVEVRQVMVGAQRP